MNYLPTGTQAENDSAAQGHVVMNKASDNSPLDPATPPWLQTLPANTSPPVVSGPNPPVVGSTMNCSTGTWSFANTYAYQWKRGATNIPGATTATHVVVTADKTFTLSCTVTAINTKGSTPVTSAPTAAVP